MNCPVIEPTNNNSYLLDKFAKICPEKSKNHFTEMRNILDDPKKTIQRPWDIYTVYIHAVLIAKELPISENTKLKDRFLVILNAFSNESVREKTASGISFDFSRIIDMINQGKTEISCVPEIVNAKDDLKVQEAALALDLLMQEGLGLSFGIEFLTTRIKSEDGWCIIARDEQNRIIASALGTNLLLVEKNIRVFHFNVLVRSPKYPLINFSTLLKKFETNLIERFNPNFLSLCVEIDNPAKEIYENAGFKGISVEYNQTLLRSAAFMLKEFNSGAQEKPYLTDIRAALNLINQKEEEKS